MTKIFVDDTKIFAECKNDEEREKLQKDLSALQEWSRTWQIQRLPKVLGTPFNEST